jgi:protein-S-isoprenylcysteine O-methyltransferase Ste14
MTEPIQPPQHRSGSPGAAVLGGILIVLGIVFFVGQQLNIDIGQATWPFYVIVPGVALVTLGLTQRRGSGLTISGSIVTIVGLVLLYQNATDRFETWAYAWPLVGPGGSGVGMLLYGTRSGDRRMARAGFWSILSALGLFVVGFIFFEGVIGISGERLPLPNWVLPVAVIVIGLLVLVRGLTYRRPAEPEWDAGPGPDGGHRDAGAPDGADQPDDMGAPQMEAGASVEEPREDR